MIHQINMDAVAKRSCDVKLFKENRYVWLHCLDLESKFELTVKSFPLLKLKFVFGHFSFTRDLSEQRLVMFPDSNEVFAKFTGVKSSCCIEVKSSAIFDVSIVHCKGVYNIFLRL